MILETRSTVNFGDIFNASAWWRYVSYQIIYSMMMIWFLNFLNLAQATVPFSGQTYVKNHLWAKAFPTSPNLWRLVAWNRRYEWTNEIASKWKIYISKLKPVKDIERLIKMGSTEMVMSSVRSSVCLCAISRSVLHLESWNFEHKSVGVCVLIVWILNPWPGSFNLGALTRTLF
jgi:hypothetical protein